MAKLTDKCKELSELYIDTADKWNEARTTSLKCYEYMLNDQWTEEQKTAFRKDGRIPLVYNMILPRLHNLFGTEQLNRVSTRIRPRDKSQLPLADILNGIYLNEWEANEGEYELQKAFADGLIMTIPGWIEVGIWYDELGYGHYSYKSANPLNVYPDPYFTDYKLRDCQYIIKEKWLTLPQIIDTYGNRPEYEKAYGMIDKNMWDRVKESLGGLFGANDESRQYYDQDGNKFKIIEMQRRVSVKKSLLYDTMTGGYKLVTNSERKKYVQDGRHMYLKEQDIPNIHITTINPYFNITLLDEPNKIECDMFDLIPYMSFDYNNIKSKNSSLVYALLDPQTNLNKREIQKTNYLDHSINSPIIADIMDKEAGEEFQEKGNKPGFVWWSRSKNRPTRMQPSSVSNDLWMDIQDSEQKMNDISGIGDTARGKSEYSNESARLFQMKTERVAATINPYYNNLTKTRKMLAEYFLKTVKQVFGDSNREVELTNPTKEPTRDIINLDIGGEVFNDIGQFEGKVIIDEATYNITKRQEDFQTKLVLFQLLGSNPQLINWEWMLSDVDMPDIQKQIDHLQMVLGQNAELQARQQALAEDQQMLEQLAIEKEITTPAPQPQKQGGGNK